MSTAMEMKQTSLNVDTMGLEFTTVYTVKMLGFSAVVVSLCFEIRVSCHYRSEQQLLLPVGRVERCTVDVETTRLNASQTLMSIQQ